MLNLTMRIKRNDEVHGKRLEAALIDFLTKAEISGATVWTGVDGFCKRGKSVVHIEDLALNMPMLIELIDEKEKIEPLLTDIKMMVDDNGLVTLHEVDVIRAR